MDAGLRAEARIGDFPSYRAQMMGAAFYPAPIGPLSPMERTCAIEDCQELVSTSMCSLCSGHLLGDYFAVPDGITIKVSEVFYSHPLYGDFSLSLSETIALTHERSRLGIGFNEYQGPVEAKLLPVTDAYICLCCHDETELRKKYR